jgi:hypothetical protein
MKTTGSVWLVAALLFAPGQPEAGDSARVAPCQAARAEGTPLRLELDLKDGSRIVGAPRFESVSLQTPYARMDAPLAQIATIRMGESHETAAVEMRNGDQLNGVMDRKPIEMETVFGKVTVGVEHIRQISVVVEFLPFSEPASADGPLPVVASGKVTESPYDFCVADFNRDGRPDVAVSCPTPDARSVNVYLNDGAGGLIERARYPVGSNPQQVVSGDFDEDGRPDLLVAVYSGSLGSGTMHVLRGKGDGTFDVGPAFSPKVGGKGLNPCYMAVGDLNKDGHLDFAVCMNNDWSLNVHYGRGDGTFEPKFALANGQNPGGLATADYNSDGWPDIACGSQYTHLFVHLSDGRGGFKPPAPYLEGTSRRQPVFAGDLDGDGDADLVVTEYQSRYATILLNDGRGSFADKGRIDFATAASPLGVTDFDADGHADLVLAGGTRLLWYPGNGDGTFRPAAGHDLDHKPALARLCDVDRDGRMDIVSIDEEKHRILMRLNRLPR